MSLQPLLDTRAASPLAGVTAKTLENWRSLGLGPKFIKAGRRVRYDPDDLHAWRDQHRIGSTSEI